MAHGAGGKATAQPRRRPARAGLRDRGARRRRGRRRARASRPTRSWSSRCASRAARSASSRSTAPSTISRWAGARPLALTLSLILEEGLDATRCAPRSTRSRARRDAAGVRIVGGDTKVVERGHADGMYITTTGLGRRDPRAAFDARAARRPDPALRPDRRARHRDHARARRVRPRRPTRSSPTRARCGRPSTRCSGRASAQLRDATRGGVASVLNELARAAGVAMLIQEAAVPVAPAVAGACELLGIDPMYVANEGVFVAIVEPDAARLPTASPTSARSRPSRPAWCWSRRASAASG